MTTQMLNYECMLAESAALHAITCFSAIYRVIVISQSMATLEHYNFRKTRRRSPPVKAAPKVDSKPQKTEGTRDKTYKHNFE